MRHSPSTTNVPPVFIDTTPAVRPAMNDNWEARRELAAALRDLNSTVLTADVPAATLRSIAASVRAETGRAAACDRLYGHQSHARRVAAQQGELPDMYYEVSPAIGQSNAVAPPMHIWREGEVFHAEATPGHGYEGPPDQVHGGTIALLFDQLLGIAQRSTGTAGQTGTLTIRYHHPTPIDRPLHLQAKVDRLEGRKKYMASELWVDDKCAASCEAVFIAGKNQGANLP